jgi:hypothetical protein
MQLPDTSAAVLAAHPCNQCFSRIHWQIAGSSMIAENCKVLLPQQQLHRPAMGRECRTTACSCTPSPQIENGCQSLPQQQQNQHEEKNKEHKEHKENKEEESIDVRGHMVLHVTPWCCALRIMTYLDI